MGSSPQPQTRRYRGPSYKSSGVPTADIYPAKAVIEGIPSLGLPTTADRDKYMAFMKIALDQRDFEGQLTNPIRFTGAEIIKLLRLRKGGFHYDEINDWCKRMVATTIMSEASVFMADRGRIWPSVLGTEGAGAAFWSQDGHTILFLDSDTATTKLTS